MMHRSPRFDVNPHPDASLAYVAGVSTYVEDVDGNLLVVGFINATSGQSVVDYLQIGGDNATLKVDTPEIWDTNEALNISTTFDINDPPLNQGTARYIQLGPTGEFSQGNSVTMNADDVANFTGIRLETVTFNADAGGQFAHEFFGMWLQGPTIGTNTPTITDNIGIKLSTGTAGTNNFSIESDRPHKITVSTGTAPFTISSTTVVTNLNADLLDGEHASAFADASHNQPASTITAGTFASGNFVFPADLTVNGKLDVEGNTTLGNATSDRVSFTARVLTDIDPSAHATHDLGATGLAWRNIWWSDGGQLRDDQGGSIELGDQGTTATTPFIDWHSGTTSLDYDYRMLASGGTAASGNGKMTYVGLEHNFSAGGLTMGAPTGGQKGTGTINVATNIYKNNTAYTNPDYVFEDEFIGRGQGQSRRPNQDREDNEGWEYKPRLPLPALKAHIAQTHRMPNIRPGPMGIFDRADVLLEIVEENTLYTIENFEKIEALEARLLVLETGSE
jgi:hypothetical protein